MTDRRRVVGKRATTWRWRGKHRVTLAMGGSKPPQEGPQHGLRRLPRVAGPARRPIHPPPQIVPADGRARLGRRELQAPRVLIVHGHRLVAEALRALLEEDGMEILALPSSPDESLEALRRNRPDLILLDLALLARGGMPWVKGIVRGGRESRIVAIGPEGGLPLEREAARNGCHAFLTADMAPPRLVVAIRDALNLL